VQRRLKHKSRQNGVLGEMHDLPTTS